jgi:pSer/pThr/pTyr-binding forkhead associated (FHA) protein
VAEASLRVLEDGGTAREYRLHKHVVTIGRLPECDVVLADPGASRRHASVRAEGGGFLLTDLGSTNGTFVNDEQVQERWLTDGDRVTIGTTVIEFRSD